MRLFLLAFLMVAPLSAKAAILNWDSRIGLSEARVETVVEAATMMETEWAEGTIKCDYQSQEHLEFLRADFDGAQVKTFTVASSVTVGGPTCPGQVFSCETTFTWLSFQEWDVKSVCEDPS